MKYSLVLEGGGARGAFEAGVWKAIKELGLEIEVIVGASIGAINGAMFAAGADTLELWENITVTDVLDVQKTNKEPLFMTYFKEFVRGGIDTTPLKNLLEKYLSEEMLRNSPIDYGLTTFDVKEKKSINLFKKDIPEGEMIDYILASACFPLFKPSYIDGKQFIDGGVKNNLPINMLAQKGCDNIIVVTIQGVGLRTLADVGGINIIEIHCDKAEIGILDFDKDGLRKSIDSGYYACMKAFGKYSGKQYHFYKESYYEALEVYGQTLLDNIEKAARILKIYPYKAYNVDELIKLVLEEYKKSPLMSAFVADIESKKHENLHKVMKKVTGIFDAASAIVYFNKIK